VTDAIGGSVCQITRAERSAIDAEIQRDRLVQSIGKTDTESTAFALEINGRPDRPSVDTSNPATDRHRKTGHHASELRLVIGIQ
jgi:hypothetical protein